MTALASAPDFERALGDLQDHLPSWWRTEDPTSQIYALLAGVGQSIDGLSALWEQPYLDQILTQASAAGLQRNFALAWGLTQEQLPSFLPQLVAYIQARAAEDGSLGSFVTTLTALLATPQNTTGGPVLTFPGGASGRYRQSVLADNPVFYPRVDESGNARVAVDQMGTKAPNLVTNPLTNSAAPDGWSRSSPFLYTPPASLTMVSSPTPQFGSLCARIVTDTASSQEGVSYALPGTFQAGVTYTVSLYVRGNAGGENVRLDFGSASDKVANTLTLTTAWQRLSVTWTPATTTSAAYLVLGELANASYTFFVNAVMVTQGASAPAFYEGNGGNDGDYIGSFSPNLITNPSFETNTTGWTTAGAPTTVARQSGWASSGSWSLRITTGPMSGAFAIAGVAQTIPVTPGTTYTFAAQLNVLSLANGCTAGILLVPNTGSGVDDLLGTIGTRRSVVTWTPAAGQTSVALYLVADSATNAGNNASADFYVDAVQVTQTPNAVPYSDTQGVTLNQAGALAGSGDTDAAVLFDGQGGYVRVPDAAMLRITGDLTLEAWVKPTDRANYYVVISKTGPGGVAGPYELALNTGDGRPYVQMGNGSAATGQIFGTTAVPAGSWSHIAAVVQSGTVTHYLNGQPNGGGSIGAQALADAGQPLAIGGTSPGTFTHKGSIDEPAVYNYALSAAQVAARYNVGLGGLTFPAGGAGLLMFEFALGGQPVAGLIFPADGSGLIFPTYPSTLASDNVIVQDGTLSVGAGPGLIFAQNGFVSITQDFINYLLTVKVQNWCAFDRGAFARAVARFQPADWWPTLIQEVTAYH